MTVTSQVRTKIGEDVDVRSATLVIAVLSLTACSPQARELSGTSGQIEFVLQADPVLADHPYPGGKTADLTYTGKIDKDAIDPLDIRIANEKVLPRRSFALRLPLAGQNTCTGVAKFETEIGLARPGTPERIWTSRHHPGAKAEASVGALAKYTAIDILSDTSLGAEVYTNADKSIVIYCQTENVPAGAYTQCSGTTSVPVANRTDVVLDAGIGNMKRSPQRPDIGLMATELECIRLQLPPIFKEGHVNRQD